jgi:hypothetical protein
MACVDPIKLSAATRQPAYGRTGGLKLAQTIQELKELEQHERGASVQCFHCRWPPANSQQLGPPFLPVPAAAEIHRQLVHAQHIIKDKIRCHWLSLWADDTRRVPQLYTDAQLVQALSRALKEFSIPSLNHGHFRLTSINEDSHTSIKCVGSWAWAATMHVAQRITSPKQTPSAHRYSTTPSQTRLGHWWPGSTQWMPAH